MTTDDTWKKIWSKRHSVRLSENWCHGSHRFRDLFGVSFPDQIITIKDGFGTGYVAEEQLNRCITYIVNRIEREGFSAVLGDGKQVLDNFLTFSKAIGKFGGTGKNY